MFEPKVCTCKAKSPGLFSASHATVLPKQPTKIHVLRLLFVKFIKPWFMLRLFVLTFR